MEQNTLLPLIGIGIIAVTVGFGTLWCVIAIRRRRTWEQTIGTIVGSQLQVSTTSNGVSGSSKALIIEWRGAEGIVHRYTEKFARTRFRIPVGKRVRLYIYPNAPHRATRALIAPGIIFGVVGTVIGAAFTTISILATR
jgi:hypothetical protein